MKRRWCKRLQWRPIYKHSLISTVVTKQVNKPLLRAGQRRGSREIPKRKRRRPKRQIQFPTPISGNP